MYSIIKQDVNKTSNSNIKSHNGKYIGIYTKNNSHFCLQRGFKKIQCFIQTTVPNHMINNSVFLT